MTYSIPSRFHYEAADLRLPSDRNGRISYLGVVGLLRYMVMRGGARLHFLGMLVVCV